MAKLASWRKNILKVSYNDWKKVDLESLNAMVQDGRMDSEDFKFITGQDYVNDQPQDNTGATEK
ncbi:hypothetical protein R4Y45_06035 [Holzapfeliella sp. He02]|uniref:XkdX family protein n=1 Tax=Holzapfeliella saturejae TaxID=3082953 RepID=A0ABU8SHA4_9LACO